MRVPATCQLAVEHRERAAQRAAEQRAALPAAPVPPRWTPLSDIDDPLDHDTPSPESATPIRPLRRDPHQRFSGQYIDQVCDRLLAPGGPLSPPPSPHPRSSSALPDLPSPPSALSFPSSALPIPVSPPLSPFPFDCVFNALSDPHVLDSHIAATAELHSLLVYEPLEFSSLPPALSLSDASFEHRHLPESPSSLSSVESVVDSSDCLPALSSDSSSESDEQFVLEWCSPAERSLPFGSEQASNVSEQQCKQKGKSNSASSSAWLGIHLPADNPPPNVPHCVAVYSVPSVIIESAGKSVAHSLSCTGSTPEADIGLPVHTDLSSTAASSTDVFVSNEAGPQPDVVLFPQPAEMQTAPNASSLPSAQTTVANRSASQPTAEAQTDQIVAVAEAAPAVAPVARFFRNEHWGGRLRAVTTKYARADFSAATPSIELACCVDGVRTLYVVCWSDDCRISVEQSDGRQLQPADTPQTFATMYHREIRAFDNARGASDKLAELSLLDFMCDLARVIPEVAQLLLNLPPAREVSREIIGMVESNKHVLGVTLAGGDVEWHTIVSYISDEAEAPPVLVAVRVYDAAEDSARIVLLSTPNVQLRLPPHARRLLYGKTTLPEVDQVLLQQSAALAVGWLSGADRSVLKGGSVWPSIMVNMPTSAISSSSSQSQEATESLPTCFEVYATGESLHIMWCYVLQHTTSLIAKLHEEVADDVPFPALVNQDVTALSE